MKQYKYKMTRKDWIAFFCYVVLMMSVLLGVVFTICFSGCVSGHVSAIDPNGLILFEADYCRLFNQEIDGMNFSSPSGYKFSFEKQKSQFELGMEFGELKATVGGEGGE